MKIYDISSFAIVIYAYMKNTDLIKAVEITRDCLHIFTHI